MASTNETETFQHYQVLRREDGTLHELGRGAMGVTYKAFDTNLRSFVALKVINALHLDSETARARFLREARAAAGLRHRNIASVYHLGNDDQSFFYAMEFVDGNTLEAMVKTHGASLAPADALQIALQVSRALGAAGKQGLVHRDIKPANIMVEREDDEEDSFVVKVIDFGLARPAAGGEGSAHITMGGFVGTPQYASPEQLEEKDLDIRSDIYSLGITLWYMLAGRPPFVGPLSSVFIQQLTKDPPWDQIAGQPERVKALLARLLQKDPARRPQSPAELRREIEACLRSLPAQTQNAGAPSVPPALVAGSQAPSVTATDVAKTRDPAATLSAATSLVPTPAPAPVPVPDEAAARPAVISTGKLLAGRYELGELIGQGNNGRVFCARDLARDQRTFAVKVLHADVLTTEGERTRVSGTIAKLLHAPHPHLTSVESLEQTPGCRFLVQEWVSGFTLVDLLRSRGHLPLREMLPLLGQTASAADHAVANALNRLELGLHQILVHFPTVPAGSAAGRALLGTPVDKWPSDFSLKLDALGITRESGDSVTWGGDMTMMPATPTLGRDTQTSIRGLVESSQLFALGLLTYELLDGAPPAPGRGEDGRGVKYAALPSLNEEANDVLRRMLTPNPGYTSGAEFFLALCKASGVPAPHASSTTIIPPSPAATTGGETMVAGPLVEVRSQPQEDEGETLVLNEPLPEDTRAVDHPRIDEPTPVDPDTLVTARASSPDVMPVEKTGEPEPGAASRHDDENVAPDAISALTAATIPGENVVVPVADAVAAEISALPDAAPDVEEALMVPATEPAPPEAPVPTGTLASSADMVLPAPVDIPEEAPTTTGASESPGTEIVLSVAAPIPDEAAAVVQPVEISRDVLLPAEVVDEPPMAARSEEVVERSSRAELPAALPTTELPLPEAADVPTSTEAASPAASIAAVPTEDVLVNPVVAGENHLPSAAVVTEEAESTIPTGRIDAPEEARPMDAPPASVEESTSLGPPAAAMISALAESKADTSSLQVRPDVEEQPSGSIEPLHEADDQSPVPVAQLQLDHVETSRDQPILPPPFRAKSTERPALLPIPPVVEKPEVEKQASDPVPAKPSDVQIPGSTISGSPDDPFRDTDHRVPTRGRLPQAIMAIAAIFLLGGLGTLFVPHRSAPPPLPHYPPKTVTTKADRTTTPEVPPVTQSAVSTPAVAANPPAGTASDVTQEAGVTPPTALPETTPDAVVSTASTPPAISTASPTPAAVAAESKTTHPRDTAARDRDNEKRAADQRALAERRDAEERAAADRREATKRDAEQQAIADRHEAEKRDAENKREDKRDVARKEPKPEPTPRPRVVAVKPPTPKKGAPKPASTPDPNENRSGPGIGFMR